MNKKKLQRKKEIFRLLDKLIPLVIAGMIIFFGMFLPKWEAFADEHIPKIGHFKLNIEKSLLEKKEEIEILKNAETFENEYIESLAKIEALESKDKQVIDLLDRHLMVC